ncbi:DegT/DnrJ/EryC1/StrS family aminotransferase [Alkalilimnicola sp. S0819]|uniref:DegT/DnrJ/EryC1/StrS family aminotransferase n=1 Tax=Alkalilimnicola sp. S0819 TaxID=2613922 RepID=UPI00126277C6|nr:DegT/DnrJ/EryC1/StrS family aminotransferase [Alkalilimnicola sp. S0819]KAB7628229.1 DegT/DnrJ/EryC1/StrS family aminotransferase [Alkalilimnicola sp. S0819]MPQ15120.1 aminotransferase DegT [Alkalilimnicola sp. S0819]
MQFVDLAAQQALIREDLDRRIKRVLDHGQYIMGPEVAELEETLAEYVGVPHAISCSSGTDALILPLLARGIGPGDAVFTTPFTFMATAEVISLLGATPIFVDIEPDTFNIDPTQLQAAIQAVREGDASFYPVPQKILDQGLTPKAVIAVDLFGLPADYERIEPLCQAEGLMLIEDAAQSFGGAIGERRVGSFGDAAATSFFPAKPFGGYGDGGMVFTADAELAEVMRSLRVHGQGADRYDNVRIGLNARLDTLQAAVLLAKWSLFADEVALRQENAGRYTALIKEQLPQVVTPTLPARYVSGWAQYTLRFVQGRDQRKAALDAIGVPSAIYYPIPLSLQAAYAGLGYRPGSLPDAERIAEQVLSLPFGPYIQEVDQQQVIAALA